MGGGQDMSLALLTDGQVLSRRDTGPQRSPEQAGVDGDAL